MNTWFYIVPLFGVVALIFTAIKASWVEKQDAGNDRMKEIAKHIAEGAMAFLRAEWRILAIFVAIASVLLAVLGYSNPESSWLIAGAFITGAVFSATAGYIGMRIATKANT
ncbi:MAG: sodium/proton-translocating pyrophosphatase, partial [Chitinophagales bacterium]|nr:sodium/proton-translocating pyrophosphatase [Chitinophagales bacterium]